MTSKRHSGLFIVLEGIDGAGTTTQANSLGDALRAIGHDVVVTREPSDGSIGKLIRQFLAGRTADDIQAPPPAALALLFAAYRLAHVQNEIRPALEAGKLVLCDRYLLSSLAYQGTENSPDWVAQINQFAVEPHLTLFLEVSAEVAARRRASRGGLAELYEDDEKQKRIAEEYLSAIKRRAPRERIVRLDGSLPQEEVTRLALGAIRKTLEL